MSTSALTTRIQEALRDHTHATESFLTQYAETLATLAERVKSCFDAGGSVLICGNGGSACDAMHIAGEFCGRFTRERKGLPAIALSADSGVITAVGNDYGFERIFARQVEALGRRDDILITLSTSGSSANIVAALEQASTDGLYRVLFTGEKGQDKANICDALFVVPSRETARIQETHMLALHLLADLVEAMVAEEA